MKNLLAATALTGLAFFAATPAFAACAPTSTPGNGQTITCSGNLGGVIVNGAGNTGVTVNLDGTATLQNGAFTDGIIFGQGTANIAGGALVDVGAAGIHINNSNSLSTVVVDGTVHGGTFGILVEDGADITVNAGATLTGGSNPAISTNFSHTNTNSIVRISDSATITGNVAAGAGTADQYHFVDDTGTTFDTTQIGTSITGFEKFYKEGATGTQLTGTTAANWNVASGTLSATAANINNVDMTNGSQLLVYGAGTVAGNITGTGNFGKEAAGRLLLTGTNNYTDGTYIDDGILAGTAASIIGTVTDNATLEITGGTFNNTVTGIGGVLVDGHTATIGGTNDFTGSVVLQNTAGLTISSADAITATSGITVDATSNLGFGADVVTDRDFSLATGSTLFNNGHEVDIDGVVSGGRLTVSGAGFFKLTGNNSYTGGVRILSGSLVGNSASILGNVAQNGVSLAFDQAVDGTYAGIISGTGEVGKIGAGKLTLSNTSTYTGTTDVIVGTLAVNGNISSSSSVVIGGGTLAGNGTVSSVNLVTGHIAPGNSIGTLHANGTVAFNAGTNYDVEYSNSAADKIVATGNITVANNAILNLTGTNGIYSQNSNYTILQSTGGTVTGRFDVVHNNLAFLDVAQNNTGTALELRLTRNNTAFERVAETQTQANTARGVEGLGTGNDLFEAFSGLTAPQARDALDDLSGAHNAGVAGAMAQTATIVQNVVSSHAGGLNHTYESGNQAALGTKNTGMAAGDAYPAGNKTVWTEAIGTTGRSDAGTGTPGQDRHSYGMIAGMDAPIGENGHGGAYAGYERGDIKTSSENASSDLNNYHAGVYGGYTDFHGVNVSAGVGGTYHDVDTERMVAFPGFRARPTGSTDGYTASGFVEVSKTYDAGAVAVEPFVNAGMTYSHVNGYTENNGGSANLAVDDVTVNNPSTILGARVGKEYQFGPYQEVSASASLGWRHNYGDLDNTGVMHFAGGTTNFEVYGPQRDRDAAVIDLNVGVDLDKRMSGYAGYTGTISQDNQDHGFKAGLKWKL